MCSGMISSPCSTCVTRCATLDTNIFWHRYSVAYNNGGRKTLEVTSTEPLGTIGSVAYFVSSAAALYQENHLCRMFCDKR